MRIVFGLEAQAEYVDAAIRYERASAGLGFRFTSQVARTLRLIQDNPFIYPVTNKRLRKAVVARFPFIIYYRVEVDLIRVIAVFHAKRHPRHWQKRT